MLSSNEVLLLMPVLSIELVQPSHYACRSIYAAFSNSIKFQIKRIKTNSLFSHHNKDMLGEILVNITIPGENILLISWPFISLLLLFSLESTKYPIHALIQSLFRLKHKEL